MDVKIGSDGIAHQSHKKLCANTVKELLRGIKKEPTNIETPLVGSSCV